MKITKANLHRFIGYRNPVETYLSIWTDHNFVIGEGGFAVPGTETDFYVEAVGDGENGTYEWIIREDDTILKYSNTGYGSQAFALREGLNEYYKDQN